MKAERLFRVLGLTDPALVEEAAERRRRAVSWKRWGALAACLALAVGLGFGWRMTGGFGGYGGGMSGSSGGDGVSGGAPANPGGSGSGGSGVENETTFMSYAGPVFPLTALGDASGLTAERETTWDFAPGAYPDGEPRQWGAEVTDHYVLCNPTSGDIVSVALYPFAGTFDSLSEIRPRVTVDGEGVEPVLYAGAYSGGFQPTFGAETPDTMNLELPGSWEEYKALLESGEYLSRALGEAPVLDMPVTVYEFSDFAAPHEAYQAATQAVSFTIDEGATQIFTYGFNGLDAGEGGFRRYSYFVPGGRLNEPDYKVLLALGKDIGDYALQGYQDGGCDPGEEIEGVRCAVTRRETTLDAELDRLCRYWEFYVRERTRDDAFDAVPFPLYRRAVAELMSQYGLLSDAPMDRYSDGRLDDILGETLGQDRVLYLAFPVTVPAGGSAEVRCTSWKMPGSTPPCADPEQADLQGYDLATRLGSGLNFTAQRAVLMNTENVELAGQNFGFDPEGGVTEVELDLEQEHYYMEILEK